MEHYAFFDFDEAHYLVRYKSANDIGDEIEDAISSFEGSDEEYGDFVKDVMRSFDVEFDIIPCRKYWI